MPAGLRARPELSWLQESRYSSRCFPPLLRWVALPDNTRNGRKPGAARLSGDGSFPKVDDATNPENLADNQHHEEGEEEQETERTHFTPTGGQPEGAKGNQGDSDHARDYVLVNSEETDHRQCRLRTEKTQL
jgi:hypothetical protein